MREIKFLAWHPEWRDVVYADNEDEYLWGKREFYPFEFRVGFSSYPKDDRWVLLQYTGMKDKDGQEIFEGDILEKPDGRRVKVVWCSTSVFAGWDLVAVNSLGELPIHPWAEEWKVIGNVYENPELLEGEKNA